jgi:glycine/D-amino acid oxidase-like deaminating enzyme
MQANRSDVLIVGGGIAGIATALDLLDGGKSVLLLDRDEEGAFGGLARESFGGPRRMCGAARRTSIAGCAASA